MADSLGDRMKEYENVSRHHLIRRMPAILRLDGRAFHTFTRPMKRPFDDCMSDLMHFATVGTLAQVQTGVLAYSQSDEISILLKDYTKLETQSWFGGNIQKIVSIAAAICSNAFNQAAINLIGACHAFQVFDARIFNVPKEDVVNYFVWRQKDATRNSINSVGQANFSHKELQGKSTSEVQEMLWATHGINWNDTPTKYKRGFCVLTGPDIKEAWSTRVDDEIPIFTENREYISRFLEPEV